MTTVYIAEKPDLAKAIEKGLGGGFTKKDGYFEKGDVQVTWALGHLLEVVKHPDYKRASFDRLPIKDLDYQYAPAQGKEAQVKVVKGLLGNANLVVHAGDVDEEGQLIVDSLLRHFRYKGDVKRVLIADFNPDSVKKALANLKDNKDYEYMGYQAEARAVADLALGMNLSIAATKVAQNQGSDDLVSVGRVQSATLGLVVARDRENQNHVKQFYHTIIGNFNMANIKFPARLKVTKKNADGEVEPIIVVDGNAITLDEKGRIISKEQADYIKKLCTGKTATVVSAKTTKEHKQPPLPFNLVELQVLCSKLFNYTPQQVMEITQSLREKHQMITYNRSDCQYLSGEQYAESGAILNSVMQNSDSLNKMVSGGNSNLKSRAFDDENITAHTAIIPTQTVKDVSQLTTQEANVYSLIAKYYIAQFYPNFEFDRTKITVSCEGFEFEVTSEVPTSMGWKVLFGSNDIDDDNEDAVAADLRTLSVGQEGKCDSVTVENKETKPRPLYTIGALLTDLTRASNYIKNKALAKVLKERDKDKKGENGGIGTPATRHSIIEKLFERGFIVEKNKKIISTPEGQALFDFLPDNIRYPDMTALWVSDFKKIKNHDQVVKFLGFVVDNHIAPEVKRFKENQFTLVLGKPKQAEPCPNCKRPMYLRNGKFGKFWRCSGAEDTQNPCDYKTKDKNGKPDLTPKTAPVMTEHNCPKCGGQLRLQEGISKKTKKPYKFYGCSNYPKCKASYWDKDGKPDFSKE